MKPRHWLFALLAALTLGRFVYIGLNELTPDEAYYHLWAQHPDWSYYSKGPGVAMAIKAGTALFGATEFGVRFLSPLFALGTSLILFSFARRLYGEPVAVWTVVVMNMIPIFQVGGMVMTIDPISIFFWAAALYTFWLALEESPRFSLYWPLTGLFIGLGFLAKYTNAMQFVSILLVLATTGKFRREFARPGFWSMLAVFALCTIPVIVWNKNHAWITLVHLQSRGGLDSRFAVHPTALLEFIGAQALVYSPLIFIGMMLALWWARTEAKWHFKPRFLSLFALPLFVMYFLLALKKPGQPNWTAPAYLSMGILATAFWYEGVKTSAWKRTFAASGLVLGLVMSLVVLNFDLLRDIGIPIPYKRDPGARLRGWKTTTIKIEELRKKFEAGSGKPAFLIGSSYQAAACVSFYLTDKRIEGPGHPPVYCPESQMIENQFSFWPRYDEFVTLPPGVQRPDTYYTEEEGVNLFVGRNALYIADNNDDRPPTAIRSGFERVEPLVFFEVQRRGQALRRVHVFACYNYRTRSL